VAPIHKWAVSVFLFSVVLVGVASIAAAPSTRRDEAGTARSSDHQDPAFFAPAGVADLTCGRCHNDYPLIIVNELGGPFTIDDCGGNQGSQCGGLFTDGYTPGRTYQMRAIISYPGMSSWGFDLWVIDQKGATAGTLIAQPNRTATHPRNQGGMTVGAVGDEGVRYRQNGRYDGPVGWRFAWRAPDTDIGPVQFFAEGTAADRDRTPRGDYSYYLNGIVVNAASQGKSH